MAGLWACFGLCCGLACLEQHFLFSENVACESRLFSRIVGPGRSD